MAIEILIIFSKRLDFIVNVYPVVALNAAFVIIKPLPIQERTLTQCHLLDYTNGDF